MAIDSLPTVKVSPEAQTLPALGAPDLLADADERRKRRMVRAALFGEAEGPERIGRFVLLRRLGAGGMGVVYAARDEQLGRDVAVKLLRAGTSEVPGERDRLLREAQALAKVSHPNVVTVHEVGFHEGRLFVAMELLSGGTLRAWLQEKKPSPQEILDVFAQAGRGLRACHDLGLVHRDFKPDNVMLDEHGIAKVLDFGLVGRAREAGPGAGEQAPSAGGEALSDKLTITGTIMGTPAYMAPEQIAGAPTDGRTDQYAFCVSLFEALHGQRPSEGGQSAAPAPGVPPHVTPALLRGLAKNPADRWPSMAELVAELARDPFAKRRRVLRGALVVGLVAAAIGVTYGVTRRPDDLPRCDGGAQEMGQVWSAEVASRLREGIVRTGVSYAEDAATRASAALDRRASAWVAAHQNACLAHLRGEQSDGLFDQKMACLARQRSEMGALIRALSEGASGAAEHAVPAVESLAPVQRCDEANTTKTPSNPALRMRVDEVRAAILEAEADDRAGQYSRSLSKAQAARAQAEAAGFRPAVAEAAYAEATALISLADYPRATGALERAYFEALASGDDDIAAHASRQAFTVIGYHQDKHDQAIPWEKASEAFAARLDEQGTLTADFLNTRGLVRTEGGKLDEAASDYARALAIYEARLGPSHLKVAMLLSNMAQVAYLRGSYDESAATLDRSLSIRLAALGEDHPDVASTRSNLSLVELGRGNTQRAISLLRSSLATHERVFGASSPQTALILNNLGNALMDAGQTEEAIASFRRVLEIQEKSAGVSVLRIARTKSNLGSALLRVGQVGPAEQLLSEALDMRKSLLPAVHADVAESIVNLGRTRAAQHKPREAAKLLREGAEMYEAALNKDHPNVAIARAELGNALMDAGDLPGAIEALDRALAIRLLQKKASSGRVDTRFALARALWKSGREDHRDRVPILLADARAEAREQGKEGEDTLKAIDAWARAAGVPAAPIPP